MTKTEKKIDKLYCYLENHCIVPDSFDPEEMMNEILVDYFNNDVELVDVRRDIISLTDDVYDHIQEMKEGSSKYEWEKIYSNIQFIEEIINFEEQEVKNIDEVIECIKVLNNKLKDLI
jgi:predicted CopG family antitoxin